jgi:hypothetical protein
MPMETRGTSVTPSIGACLKEQILLDPNTNGSGRMCRTIKYIGTSGKLVIENSFSFILILDSAKFCLTLRQAAN